MKTDEFLHEVGGKLLTLSTLVTNEANQERRELVARLTANELQRLGELYDAESQRLAAFGAAVRLRANARRR